ncbi:MAG: tRNA (adenosine(37)-N6)-dimethylallyltransferase MiaA [Cyanobacteriota bacterium]|nr:tRNA (adenosine(37)-N6)-dimethylallyltransferase MiaA [Cyanobacteriota bacterium]
MENHPAPPPLVIALVGPTASGKTALGIAIAAALDLAVLSVDSRQLYRGMDIGTATPTAAQRARVRHELLDLRDPDQPLNVQDFAALARVAIQREQARRGMALLVGGSGLYLQALTGGLQPPPVPAQPWLRHQLDQLGQSQCHALLAEADPASACRIGPGDAVRTQRALEILYATGQPPSALRQRTPPPWRLLELGLDPPDLASRIRRRTRAMYATGLLPETAALLERFGPGCPLLDTIGYGEARRLLAGELELEQAIALTDQRTRQYAKRQRTWFRRQHRPQWLQGLGRTIDRGGTPAGNGADLLSEALVAISQVLG